MTIDTTTPAESTGGNPPAADSTTSTSTVAYETHRRLLDEKKKIQMQFHRDREMISFQGIPILQYYPDYREEQKQSNPNGHYHDMWKNHNIYHKIPIK